MVFCCIAEWHSAERLIQSTAETLPRRAEWLRVDRLMGAIYKKSVNAQAKTCGYRSVIRSRIPSGCAWMIGHSRGTKLECLIRRLKPAVTIRHS